MATFWTAKYVLNAYTLYNIILLWFLGLDFEIQSLHWRILLEVYIFQNAQLLALDYIYLQ